MPHWHLAPEGLTPTPHNRGRNLAQSLKGRGGTGDAPHATHRLSVRQCGAGLAELEEFEEDRTEALGGCVFLIGDGCQEVWERGVG